MLAQGSIAAKIAPQGHCIRVRFFMVLELNVMLEGFAANVTRQRSYLLMDELMSAQTGMGRKSHQTERAFEWSFACMRPTMFFIISLSLKDFAAKFTRNHLLAF